MGLLGTGATGSWASLTALCFVAVFAGCGGGGPSPGGACQSNRDCVAGETCVSGTCRAGSSLTRCRSEDQCPLDQWCDLEAGECRPLEAALDGGLPTDASAGDGSEPGGPDAAPRDANLGGSCSLDEECGNQPDYICIGNLCVLGCHLPDGLPCTGGTVCNPQTGQCVSQGGNCTLDQQCEPGPPTQICLANQCVYGCGVDRTLCQANEICNTNTGRCVAAPTHCTMDSQCSPPMTVCESGQCVPGCNQAGGVQCSGATPLCDSATGRCTDQAACNLDADCAADPNRICVNSACVLRCNAPGATPCPSPLVCNAGTGRCISGGFPLGANCALDAECASRFCLGLNVGMSNLNICADPCGATSQCPRDFTCAYVSGMRFCLNESLFNNVQFDIPSGGACGAGSNNCQSGYCNNGNNQCLEVCSRNGDCGSFGGQCWTYQDASGPMPFYENFCLAPGSGSAPGANCTTNANCRSGVCNRYSNTCAQHCCSQADCAANQSCAIYDLDANHLTKVCVPRAAGSNGALGASCNQPSDCQSGVCVPVDPAAPMGARRCSTLCCRNQDCAAVPNATACRPAAGPVTNSIVGVCSSG